MFYSENRNEMRTVFFDAWLKAKNNLPLEPLEQQIVALVEQHPEYQDVMSNPEGYIEQDYTPEGGESNPFLHLAMHLSIRDQVQTDRPAGIRLLFNTLALKLGDQHTAEHQIMECLGAEIWQAQRDGTAPDEQRFLDHIRNLM